MHGYNHQTIEKRAQEKWAQLKLFETNLVGAEKDPYYLLVELPYTSGDIHLGHWYAFSVTDIYARYLRMRGKNVFFPIGFDSFGLPAENAAIKRNLDPKRWTYENIEHMRRQLKSMGASFDWNSEVITADPGYYKWTQWLFVKFFEHDLAYRKEAAVKWCPKDQTVLANEQVVDGCCERCGTPVEEKRLTQWFLKITDYAERLLNDLDGLPWREEIKEAQRAWIGKSEGANISFAISGRSEKIEVFTTRPDTIYGATYVVLAPEHSLVSALLPNVSNKKEVKTYISATTKKTERERSENKEKTGVKLEGILAINPATKEEIPIYIADYVLGSYGTGAVMAVPAHDDRDFEFAKKHNLPIKKAKAASAEVLVALGAKKTTQYRLRDWLISRQRYWGCPIPIVYDPKGKPHAVPPEHLPWLLPEDVGPADAGGGRSPLAASRELAERVEKLFGKGWTPEYDTLDVFVDSSWYFARYLDPKDEHDFSDQKLMKKWLPVSRYSGGSEHTTMHLLYARFFYKALHDLALVPTTEPFAERFNRGIILGPDGAKMSKSKGNVINPDDLVREYGADAVRLYLAFIGPYNEPGHYPWNPSGVRAMRKFLERVVRMVESVTGTTNVGSEFIAGKVRRDVERFKFNTAIAALMSFLNLCEAAKPVSIQTAKEFVILLAPFVPHLAEHLHETLGGAGAVAASPWLTESSRESKGAVELVVQIVGRKRGSVQLHAEASEAEALAEALKIPAVQNALGGKEPSRVIYIPGKVLNLVV